MAKELVVEVRQEHWDTAFANIARLKATNRPFPLSRSTICAVALAIRDAVPEAVQVSVAQSGAHIDNVFYVDGTLLEELVNAFDGHPGAVKPTLPVTLTLTEDDR